MRSPATAEIAWVGSHYAIQSHSSSPIFTPIESPHATSYYSYVSAAFKKSESAVVQQLVLAMAPPVPLQYSLLT